MTSHVTAEEARAMKARTRWVRSCGMCGMANPPTTSDEADVHIDCPRAPRENWMMEGICETQALLMPADTDRLIDTVVVQAEALATAEERATQAAWSAATAQAGLRAMEAERDWYVRRGEEQRAEQAATAQRLDALREEVRALKAKQRPGQALSNAIHALDPSFWEATRNTPSDAFNHDEAMGAMLTAWRVRIQRAEQEHMAAICDHWAEYLKGVCMDPWRAADDCAVLIRAQASKGRSLATFDAFMAPCVDVVLPVLEGSVRFVSHKRVEALWLLASDESHPALVPSQAREMGLALLTYAGSHADDAPESTEALNTATADDVDL